MTYRQRRAIVLRTLRAVGAFAIARRLTGRDLRVLCYHGFSVRDEHEFRPGLFIRPETLERRLAYLADAGYPVLALPEALRRLGDGTLPRGATVITIDDGFRSTCTLALPRFRRHRVPVTLYLTTYHVLHQEPIFNLTVQYLFSRTDRADVDLGGLGLTGVPARVAWGALDAGARTRVVDAVVVHGQMHLDRVGRQDLLAALGARLGVDFARVRDEGLMSLVSPEQVSELRAGGVEIELHTHRHWSPNEYALSMREITDNAQVIHDLTGRTPVHLCYPSGRYDGWRSEWLEEAGIESATTTETGFATAATPRFAIPRFLDGENIDQLDFEAEMSGFLELARRLQRRLRGRRAPQYTIDPAEQRPRTLPSPVSRLSTGRGAAPLE